MGRYEFCAVGQVVDSFKNHQEGVVFDITDSGAIMKIFCRRPTQEEMEQFKDGKQFEIRFIELYGVIMITVKIGNLNWMDAPYTPHLSKNLSELQPIGTNQGLALTIMLIDTATGEIKHLRLIGLSEKFTKQLFKTVAEQKRKPFSVAEYSHNIYRIFSTYSTVQLAKMSYAYCKMRPTE